MRKLTQRAAAAACLVLIASPWDRALSSSEQILASGPNLLSSTRHAEVIALGVVGEKSYFVLKDPLLGWDRVVAYTDYELRVENTWKGCAKTSDVVRFRCAGGQLTDSTWMDFSGVPMFQKGERIAAFLQYGTGHRWQGVWKLMGYSSFENGRAFGALGSGEPISAFTRRTRTLIDSLGAINANDGIGIAFGRVARKDGEPLANVAISIDGHDTTSSDREGLFRIPDLPAGCHRLGLRADGFRALSTVMVVVPGRTDTISIALPSQSR